MDFRRCSSTMMTMGVVVAWVIAAPAAGKPAKAPALPPTMLKLVDCRQVADDAQRLACYDREVAALEGKVRTKELAVVDRAEVQKTRRTLFGIPLPTIKLFDSDDEPELKEVNAVVRSVSQGEGGRLVFTLDDGATWVQTDDFPIFGAVRPGHKVTLKRGAFGSYFADFEKTVPVRAKRIR